MFPGRLQTDFFLQQQEIVRQRYDRDGNYEIACLKGDNYLHDISNKKGHTYPLAKNPLYFWEDILSFSNNIGIALSPDESIVMTGTSVRKGKDYSTLNFYSTFNYTKIKEMKVSKSSCVDMIWNEKLNQ